MSNIIPDRRIPVRYQGKTKKTLSFTDSTRMTRRRGIGLVLVVFLLLAGTASAYPRAILFTFDDSRASDYLIAYPIFESHGYKATYYLTTSNVDPAGTGGMDSINLTELQILYDAGWDLADHTRNHTYVFKNNLTLEDQIAQIQGGKDDLNSWGFTRASSHLAFPGGDHDSNTSLAMAAAGMLTGRTTESEPLTVPLFNNDLYHLTGLRPLDPKYEAEEYPYLESLTSDNVVIYLLHGVDDPPYAVTTNTTLKNMLNYVDSHDIPVWTITQLYANISVAGKYSPAPHTLTLYPTVDGQVSRAVDNSTFESLISGGGTNFNYTSNNSFGPALSTYVGTQPGKFKTYTVGVLSFDTHSIPAGAKIESASLVLHEMYYSSDDLGPFTMVITNGTIASGTSLRAADYQSRGNLELTDRKPFSFITSGNNTFTFNQNGKGWINRTGSTVLFLRRGDDVDGTYAGGPEWAVPNKTSEHRWYSNDATDTGDRPHLQIDYTLSSVAPVANFTANITQGSVPLAVKFTDLSEGTNISKWNWDFNNDGTVDSTLQNPEYTYKVPNVYTVNLTVEGTAGSDSEVKVNYIIAGPVPVAPIANFTATSATGSSPLTVTFVDLSIPAPVAWNWSFTNVTGNNTPVWFSTDQNPVYTFGVGNYSIVLNASNIWGYNLSTQVTFINVTAAPTASKIGVFRPSTHMFYLRPAGYPATPATVINWGASTDTPVTGDWNGDGITDIGVFRPSTHMFYLRNGTTSWTTTAINWGVSTDLPVTGDWNGDGVSEVGVYRPSAHTFYLKNSTAASWTTTAINWGMSADLPVTGDWNGDGVSEVGVYRPSAHTFYLKNGTAASWTTTSINWGVSTGLPVTGDWNGDGVSEVGVYHPSTHTFYLRSANYPVTPANAINWGESTDLPITGIWN
jgi:PKD repeat protein/peptidoglycan/xylan/chitin deacetylase (PgdA/CDA1 family)